MGARLSAASIDDLVVQFLVRPSWRLRRRCLAALGALLAVAACTSDRAPHPRPVTPHTVDGRPNIVFVLTDDLSTNLVPYMPHVEALMQAGTSFADYFVVDSLCCPSRSAIFTGEYPHDDGVFTNNRADGGYAAYNHFGNPPKSFAVGLHDAGYRTALMGKYLNGYPPRDPPAPGWDEWDVAGSAYAEYHYRLNHDGSARYFGTAPDDYLTGVLDRKAASFVATATDSGKPFALEVATFAPHRPATPAPEDRESFPSLRAPRGLTYNRQPTGAPSWLAGFPPLTRVQKHNIDSAFRLRVESVQAVDRMIGHLEQVLAAHHELANTYFVFSSDNGYHMGDYRLLPGKQTAFDTDIRVPLVVAGPGVPAGRTVPAMASSIDLAPTFAQIAGARLTGRPDGVSLLSLLHGEPTPASWQRAVLVEHHGPVLDAGDPDLQPSNAGDPPSYEAMRTRTFVYVEYATGEREYYDLLRDPDELHNLAASLSRVRVAQLHTQLNGLVHCHGAAQCQRAAALTPAG